MKFRFKSNSGDIHDFSADFNINVITGYSLGWTKFMYRKGIENFQRDTCFMIGGFLGSSVVELSSSNTYNDPLEEDEDYNRGVISYGFGLGYSLGNFQFALLYGWENTIGQNSSIWIYDGQPWVGAGLGFEIF